MSPRRVWLASLLILGGLLASCERCSPVYRGAAPDAGRPMTHTEDAAHPHRGNDCEKDDDCAPGYACRRSGGIYSEPTCLRRCESAPQCPAGDVCCGIDGKCPRAIGLRVCYSPPRPRR